MCQTTRLELFLACIGFATGFAAASAQAIEKVDETFSSEMRQEGASSSPANTITQGVMGEKVIYWTKWRNEDTSHRVAWRCVITFHEESDAVYDNTFSTPDDRPEGYTYCGIDTSDDRYYEGTYRFTVYADGKTFGEGTMSIHKKFLSRLHLSPLKLGLGALALVIIGVGWLRKKKAD
jgi:hypothetical protein